MLFQEITIESATEYRVIGPPGTGKTTYLARQAALALEACRKQVASAWDGDPSRGVLICSLTKAAANEIRNRGLDLPPEQIGTLHAHAFRALGRPTLCVDGKPLAEWNAACDPEFRISAAKGREAPDQDGPGEDRGSESGNRLLASYHTARSRLRPRELWHERLAAFASEYESWKRVSNYVDFSDVIHMAWESVEAAPGYPRIIFVDEAQDNDRAELRLVRKWARHAEKIVIIGDPDQNLYEWRGSDPEAFYESKIPETNTRVLAQSYRVPEAVHAEAVAMIDRCTNRRPVTYHPRPSPGEVLHSGVPIAGPAAEEIMHTAKPLIEAGKTVMFLFSCEYMSRHLIERLRELGIPFWNPFAKDRGRFNPLHPPSGVPVARKLAAYLRPNMKAYSDEARLWNHEELALWTKDLIITGFLKRGARKEIEEAAKAAPSEIPNAAALKNWCENSVLPPLLIKADPLFLVDRAQTASRRSYQYAANVYRNYGVRGLVEKPRVIVGTIHSVKGGEADAVFLAPDLSPGGWDQLESGYPDPVYRLFYVAMTRARETLVLCEPESERHVTW